MTTDVGLLLTGLCLSHWKLTIRGLVEQGGMEQWLTAGSTTPSKLRSKCYCKRKSLHSFVLLTSMQVR